MKEDDKIDTILFQEWEYNEEKCKWESNGWFDEFDNSMDMTIYEQVEIIDTDKFGNVTIARFIDTSI